MSVFSFDTHTHTHTPRGSLEGEGKEKATSPHLPAQVLPSQVRSKDKVASSQFVLVPLGHNNDTHRWIHTQRGAKVGLQLWNPEFILVLLFMNYIIFHTNNCKPTFAPPCIPMWTETHLQTQMYKYSCAPTFIIIKQDTNYNSIYIHRNIHACLIQAYSQIYTHRYTNTFTKIMFTSRHDCKKYMRLCDIHTNTWHIEDMLIKASYQ